MSESEQVRRRSEVSSIDNEAIAKRIYEQAATHRDRELDQALTRLRSDGDLTEDQRQILETLAHSLTDQLLSAPCEAIRSTDDPETLRAALTIFDPRT